MKVIKKINNNFAVGIDGNGDNVILYGKGIGFGTMPYELQDMSRVDSTFYNIDHKYYGLLHELDESVFVLVSKLVRAARMKLEGNLNPNLEFILADHINFAITRLKKGMYVPLPYSHELEYEYPEHYKVARWMLKQIQKYLHITLQEGEVTSIMLHLINAMEGSQDISDEEKFTQKYKRILKQVTAIIEEHFQVHVEQKGFNYFRFKNHMKYMVQRRETQEEYQDTNQELFQSMKESYPDVYACVEKIDRYMETEYREACSKDELLYLMIHVNRLYTAEDCNRKGITPKD